MKARRNIFLLCGLVITLVGVAAFTLKRTASSAQEPDPKAEIRHQRREARYNVAPYLFSKTNNGTPWSKRRDGDFNATHIHYGEIIDINDPAALAGLRDKEALKRQKHICAADIIVKGEVVSAKGVITDDDNFIYTVYGFAITEVMRAKDGIELSSDDTIQFTSPGGTAIVEGADGKTKSVTFNYALLDQLKPNTQYLLYLRRDQEADDYYVTDREGVFVVEGDTITRMDAVMEPFFKQRAQYLEAPVSQTAIANAVESANCGR